MMWTCSAFRGARPAIEETAMPRPALIQKPPGGAVPPNATAAAFSRGRALAVFRASCVLALAFPVQALESVRAADVETHPHAEQRRLLEAYVACIEATGTTADRVGATLAGACPRERAAYRATLPDERADEILRALDRGPGDRQ